MATTTPKRKRGQHAKRHPWSNPFGNTTGRRFPDSVTETWELWQKWQRKQAWYSDLTVAQKLNMAAAFMAGYRAGKDAK